MLKFVLKYVISIIIFHIIYKQWANSALISKYLLISYEEAMTNNFCDLDLFVFIAIIS